MVGVAPTGFRPPGDVTEETVDLLLETGHRWSSITRGDDRPLFLPGGADGNRDAIVDIPRSWDLDDASRFLFNYDPPFPKGQGRIASYRAVAEDWITEFDAIVEFGRCFVLTLDPQSIGTAGRIGLLEEVLDHIAERPDVWVTTGDGIDAWWRSAVAEEEWPPEGIRRRERERLASPI